MNYNIKIECCQTFFAICKKEKIDTKYKKILRKLLTNKIKGVNIKYSFRKARLKKYKLLTLFYFFTL